MRIDIGAKRPIDGTRVFLVGRCIGPAEPSFVLLYDALKGRESKRNLQKVDAQAVVRELGGESHFAAIDIPTWGTAWFRVSSIRKVIEMSPHYLRLGSQTLGARVLFKHDPDPVDESSFPVPGFSLHGIAVEQASRLLSARH